MPRAKSKKIAGAKAKVANAITQSVTQTALRNTQNALGYRHPQTTDLITSPEVVRAVRAGLVRRLVAEGAPRSIGLLIRIVEQGHAAADRGESPTSIQADAAKSLIQFAGLQAVAEEKDVAEMSDQELRQMLEQFSAEAAKRSAIDAAGTINAPDDAPVDSQATDTVESLFS